MSASTTEIPGASCPECEGAVAFRRAPLRGEVVSCAECRVELEVVDVNPVTLAPAPEVQEDWGE